MLPRPTLVLLAVLAAGVLGDETSSSEAAEKCDESEEPPKRVSSKWAYQNLREAIERIRAACGDLCDTTKMGEPGKLYYDFIQKEVDCKAIFASDDIDAVSEFNSPPQKIPKFLKDEFTYQGRIPIKYVYYDGDSGGGMHWMSWDDDMIRKHLSMLDHDILGGSYGRSTVHRVREFIAQHLEVAGKHVLVIGSQRPWLESILLAAGASHITTVDYLQITCTYEKITTVTMDDFAKMYLNGTMPHFDAVVTYSSLEHAGLGRYDDALNPWGDLIAMARIWCVMPPGTRALVGVPAGPSDILEFNGARIYGPLSFSHLFANWRQIAFEDLIDENFREDNIWGWEPLHVLERI